MCYKLQALKKPNSYLKYERIHIMKSNFLLNLLIEFLC